MKILKRKLTAYLLTFAVLLGVVPISGNAAGTEDSKTPDNGIPLLIINIDEDAGGDRLQRDGHAAGAHERRQAVV